MPWCTCGAFQQIPGSVFRFQGQTYWSGSWAVDHRGVKVCLQGRDQMAEEWPLRMTLEGGLPQSCPAASASAQCLLPAWPQEPRQQVQYGCWGVSGKEGAESSILTWLQINALQSKAALLTSSKPRLSAQI